MKLTAILFAAAAVAAMAQETPAPAPADAGAAGAAAGTPAGATVKPATGSKAAAGLKATTGSKASTTGSSAAAGGAAATGGLDSFKATKAPGNYHMEPITVVHARVQGDSPVLQDGVFVSKYGKDLKSGYLAAMDNVNTASVEGALMYVQAEGIDVANRAPEERCVRKYKMNNIVFYRIKIAQTNETIAQFSEKWSAPEYGPMVPMDVGICTPTKGQDEFPVACYQFNGEKGQPNLGPFIGGESKELDDRAPYPDNYWFSFPNSCPHDKRDATTGQKPEKCRKSDRKGLCDYGVAPNGVDCTFAYEILGWVPIDDVVGITLLQNNVTNKPFNNFTEWCEADTANIEYDSKSGNGLDFWKNATKEANKARAQMVVEAYTSLLENKNSTQIDSKLIANFKALPTPEEMAKTNPPCYKSVPSCGSGNGCKRTGYSQLCVPCKDGEKCETGDGKFKFPKLEKAKTTLTENETDSTAGLNNTSGGASGKKSGSKGAAGSRGGKSSSAASVTLAAATVVASLMVSAFAF
ncbi:TPA: hypothetical protein N0F65_010403 [Lagenidium giganteum]|uniref:Uncharacterized protein n=1 Tax=Lagenidium giganteum TaxID=4803 RepID=A0AAV2YU63_9STRA|nr:TPA: hypothetical protein N0F65_010403 [Lagenidium giganteum]